jgi:hypothetical protein
LLSQLGKLHQVFGELDEAEAMMRRCVAAWESAHGAGHPNSFKARRALGDLQEKNNKLDEAEANLRACLKHMQTHKRLGPEHAFTVDMAEHLAEFLRRNGRAEEGDAIVSESEAAWAGRAIPEGWTDHRKETRAPQGGKWLPWDDSCTTEEWHARDHKPK